MINRQFSLSARLFAGFAVLGAAASVFGQTLWQNNPNIIVPKSGLEVKGHKHTDYLIYRTGGGVPEMVRRVLSEPSFGPYAQAEGGAAYTPNDIHAAYDIPPNLGTGAIAIVDAFGLSTELADFNLFCKTYNLPQEPSKTDTLATNQVLQVEWAGATRPTDQDTGWGGEIALDIEWAHAMAPTAKIYLVLAQSDSTVDLDAAVAKASSIPGVKEVSMSWGSTEYAAEVTEDTFFQTPGIVYFASTGDIGGIQQYPSESPYVVGVGGTDLNASEFGWLGETAWLGSGGGPSAYELKPSWQVGIPHTDPVFRSTPDSSAIAGTPVWVYSKSAYGGTFPSGWGTIGGTSLACPVTAAITNDRGTWTHSSPREEERIYFNLGGPYYRDITAGVAGPFEASQGYDFITGIGTPDGIFPAYFPPEALQARSCGVYLDGKANFANSQQTQILAAVANQDNVLYSVTSVPTSLGQTADIALNFVMDKDLRSLTSAPMTVYGTAPAGTTFQVFAKDFNPADSTFGQLVYTGYSAPASGAFGNFSFPMQPNFVQTGTGAVSLVVRAIRPPHISTLPFNYSIDKITLNEVSVPPWDVNLPL